MHQPDSNTAEVPSRLSVPFLLGVDTEPPYQPTDIHNHECFVCSSSHVRNDCPPLKCKTCPTVPHCLRSIILSYNPSPCRQCPACTVPSTCATPTPKNTIPPLSHSASLTNCTITVETPNLPDTANPTLIPTQHHLHIHRFPFKSP